MTNPDSLFEDVWFNIGRHMRTGNIDMDALTFTTRPYVEMFSGEPTPQWTYPDDDMIRAHLRKNWSEEEVDGYFARRDESRRERDRQLAWEATFRGRATMAWRGFQRESKWRVSTAWMVLRHGKTEDDE